MGERCVRIAEVGGSNPPISTLRSEKIRALFILISIYLLTLMAALGAGYFMRGQQPLLIAFYADIIATIVVFVFSLIFNNSSIYDPYWSVAPVPIAIYWALNSHSTHIVFRKILVLLLLLIWATRLTYNCLSRWQSIKNEDWRYAEKRKNVGRLYWLLSFWGFHIFPTVLVFLGCLSLYPALITGANRISLLDAVGLIIGLAGIYIEAKSDNELKKFKMRRKQPEDNIDEGIWKYSRHPNYFGEVLFWWTLYIFAIAADLSYWWMIIGPCSITLLFVFISIPMMDGYLLKKKKGYMQYMEKVPSLIPWPLHKD